MQAGHRVGVGTRSLFKQLVEPVIWQLEPRPGEPFNLKMELGRGEQTLPPMFGIWISGDKRQRGEVITGNSGGVVFVNCLRPEAQPQRAGRFSRRETPTENTAPLARAPPPSVGSIRPRMPARSDPTHA